MKKTSTIAIIDDEADLRESVSQWLQLSDFTPVTFDSAEAALRVISPEFPGIILSDIKMPGIDGMALLRRLQSVDPGLPVILMTGHGDVPMAVRAMKSGAIDFIEKPFNDEVLLDAIRRAIARGEQQRSHHSEHLQIQERLSHLTPREHEVMQMVTEGRSNKEIANMLGVSAKTIEAHRARVMEKMQAGSLAELVRMVLAVNGHD